MDIYSSRITENIELEELNATITTLYFAHLVGILIGIAFKYPKRQFLEILTF